MYIHIYIHIQTYIYELSISNVCCWEIYSWEKPPGAAAHGTATGLQGEAVRWLRGDQPGVQWLRSKKFGAGKGEWMDHDYMVICGSYMEFGLNDCSCYRIIWCIYTYIYI